METTASEIASRRRIPWREAGLILLFLLPPGINLWSYWTRNPLYGYGVWVLPLAALLAWGRRGIRLAPVPERVRHEGLAWGVMGLYLASAVPLRIVQVANPDWRLLDWALAGGAVCASLASLYRCAGLEGLRRFAAPLLFLLVAVPWPMNVETGMTGASVPLISRVSVELLWRLGVPVVDAGNSLRTPVGVVSIVDDCGGIRSFQLALVSVWFWGVAFRLRGLRLFGLVAAGLLLSLAMNLLRVCGLIAGSVWSGKAEVVPAIHDTAGQASQLLLLASLFGVAWLLARGALARRVPELHPARAKDPVPIPYRAPSAWLLAGVVAWLVAGEVAGWAWYRRGEGPDAGEARWVPAENPPIEGFSSLMIPDTIRRHYPFSFSRYNAWKDERGGDWTFAWLGFEKGDLSACTHNIHRPEICLPSANFVQMGRFPELAVAVGGEEIRFQHGLYRRGGDLLHLFHVNLHGAGGEEAASRSDWTYRGRIEAARLGLKSRRADLIHLSVTHPYTPEAARFLAVKRLAELIARTPSARAGSGE